MKTILVLAILGLMADGQEPSCNVDPQLFCSPFRELAAEMPDTAKQELLALPKEKYIGLHLGLGMHVRNRFGLWEDNELTQYFRGRGIDHPDSMSQPFIEGYVLYLQGQPVVMSHVVGRHVTPYPLLKPSTGQ